VHGDRPGSRDASLRAVISLSLSLSLALARSRSCAWRGQTRLVSRCLVRFPRSYNGAKCRRVYRDALRRVYFYQRKCVVVRARIPARRLPGKGDAGGTRAARCTFIAFSRQRRASPSRSRIRAESITRESMVRRDCVIWRRRRRQRCGERTRRRFINDIAPIVLAIAPRGDAYVSCDLNPFEGRGGRAERRRRSGDLLSVLPRDRKLIIS